MNKTIKKGWIVVDEFGVQGIFESKWRAKWFSFWNTYNGIVFPYTNLKHK